MAPFLIVSGFLGLVAAAVHGGLGTRAILRPTLAAPLSRLVCATQEGAWHVLTWHFAVLGAALIGAVWLPPTSAEVVARIAGATALGHASIMFTVGWRRFGDPWHLPQWVLFLPMGTVALLAAQGDGLASPVAASLAAALASVVLAVIAGLHLVWAAGASFPARDRDALVASVVGAPIGQPMPGRAATVLVAGGLVLAAWWVAVLGGLASNPLPPAMLRAGGWAMVAAFGLRGLGGFFEVALRPSIRGTRYMRYSRLFYSPLAVCLAALVGCAMLA